jgi:hypothetical protein
VPLDCPALACFKQVDDRAAGFRAVPQMHPPLLIPDCLDRFTGDCRQGRGDVRLAHGGKAILGFGADVGIAGVQWRLDGVQRQVGDEV